MKKISKKGQVSRTVILFGVLIFYSVMFVFYGLYGATMTQYNNADDNAPNYLSGDYTGSLDNNNATAWSSTGQQKAGLGQLTKYVVTGFKETPLWLNIIFFVPLGILVAYLILASFIPTINAGG